jgi:hypothetical protein
MKRINLAAVLLAGYFIGCGGGSTNQGDPMGDPLISSPDGKTDFSTGVAEKGWISWDASVKAEFIKDFEFHVYSINVKKGANYKLNIAKQGTSTALDPTMFLYSTKSNDRPRELIAKDDHSGEDSLPMLSGTFGETGVFYVVVGTADMFGRGEYQLQLACLNSLCKNSSDPMVLQEVDLPLGVTQWANQFEGWECISVNAQAAKWSPTPNPDVYNAVWPYLKLFKKMMATNWFDEWQFGGLSTAEQVEAALIEHIHYAYQGDELENIYKNFESAAGLARGSYIVGKIGWSYQCAASVTCFGTAFLLLDTDNQMLFSLNLGSADEC